MPKGVLRRRVMKLGLLTLAEMQCSSHRGEIGGDIDLVKASWPERLGPVPKNFVIGVPAHVDGRMIQIAKVKGARSINSDRMWH